MYDAPGSSAPNRIRKKSGIGDREVAEQHAGGEAQPSSSQRQAADDEPVAAGRAAAGPSGRPRRRRSRRGTVERGRHSAPIRPRRTSARKTGTPTTAVMIPTCTSVGGSTTRPTVSASDDQRRRRTPSAQRQHRARSREPDDRAHAVRDDQADEGDRAGQRGGAAGQQHAPPGRAPAGRRRTPAEAAGQVVAEGQRVEQPGAGQREHRADDEERQPGQQHVEARGRRRCRPARTGTSPSSAGRSAARRTSSWRPPP